MLVHLLGCVFSALAPTPQATPLPRPQPVFRPEVVLADVPAVIRADAGNATIGSRLVVEVWEVGMHQDLNADGDQLDQVWHVVDLTSGTLLGLGIASADIALASPDLEPVTSPTSAFVLIGVDESDQGEDLNGDGDLADSLFHGLDPATGTVRNSGLAGTSVARVHGSHALLGVSESQQGGDLNGDGTLGTVAYLWDLAGPGAPLATGLPITGVHAAHAGFFLVGVLESAGAQDRNGDGDATDVVLHAIETSTGTVTNAAVALATHVAQFFAPVVEARGAHSVSIVSELRQSEDLNGDGDLLDDVPFVFGPWGFRNVGIAVGSTTIGGGHGTPIQPNLVALGDEVLVLLARESDHDSTDLNGDGDVNDSVLLVHTLADGTTVGLGQAAFRSALQEPLLVYQAREDAQGSDWNDDGDLDDLVLRVYDLERETDWNLGLTSFHTNDMPQVHGRLVALTHAEPDGSTDPLLVLADARTQDFLPTDLAPTDFRIQPGGVLSVSASEGVALEDLNGDGDLGDQVLHVLYPRLGVELNTGATGVPMDGDGRRFPFAAREVEDGVDRNGDGDLADVTLRLLRVKVR